MENDEIKVLVRFIEKTKDGKYAEIEKTSMRYSRMFETTFDNDDDNHYYFGLS